MVFLLTQVGSIAALHWLVACAWLEAQEHQTWAYVLAETITCKAPNIESLGALPTRVSLQIGGEGWTVNELEFSYFANTAPSLCLAYGPGLFQASTSL